MRCEQPFWLQDISVNHVLPLSTKPILYFFGHNFASVWKENTIPRHWPLVPKNGKTTKAVLKQWGLRRFSYAIGHDWRSPFPDTPNIIVLATYSIINNSSIYTYVYIYTHISKHRHEIVGFRLNSPCWHHNQDAGKRQAEYNVWYWFRQSVQDLCWNSWRSEDSEDESVSSEMLELGKWIL